MYWHFCGIFMPVVVEVTLGYRHHVCCSSLFSGTGACWETLHHPQRSTWDESMHMCHAGGHRQCVISDSFPTIPPYHRTAAAPKTKIIFHRDEVTTAKACAVGVSESKTLLWVCEIGATLSLQVVSQIYAQLMAFLRPNIKHALFFVIKKKFETQLMTAC